MATYVIGDIHGCYQTLKVLLEKLPLDAKKDRLWLTGDLVNRGPASAQVLRWAMKMSSKMGRRFGTVLGNHDLHLIAIADGTSPVRSKDRLDKLLEQPDCDELIDWLRQQPFLIERKRYTLVHAGLHPNWTLEDARHRAAELEQAFASIKKRRALLSRTLPADAKPSIQAARTTLDYLTRVRTCSKDRSMAAFAGHPGAAPNGSKPWYRLRKQTSKPSTIVFGHWAALGLLLDERFIGLDTACSWGHQLTAIRLKDRKLFSTACRDVIR